MSHTEDQAPVVQKVDNVTHRINHYPVDKYQHNPLCYPLDTEGLSIFEQPGTELLGTNLCEKQIIK